MLALTCFKGNMCYMEITDVLKRLDNNKVRYIIFIFIWTENFIVVFSHEIIGRGVQVYNGIAPIVGLLENTSLFVGLIRHLQCRNIIVLKQVVKEVGDLDITWLIAEGLHLFSDWTLEWDAYITSLTMACIRLEDHNSNIVWCLIKK